MRVKQIVTRGVQTCGTSDTLDKALQLMWDVGRGCSLPWSRRRMSIDRPERGDAPPQ